jgi:hypothetical protein
MHGEQRGRMGVGEGGGKGRCVEGRWEVEGWGERRAPVEGRLVHHDRSRLAQRLHPRRHVDHVPLRVTRSRDGTSLMTAT